MPKHPVYTVVDHFLGTAVYKDGVRVFAEGVGSYRSNPWRVLKSLAEQLGIEVAEKLDFSAREFWEWDRVKHGDKNQWQDRYEHYLREKLSDLERLHRVWWRQQKLAALEQAKKHLAYLEKELAQ